MFYRILFICLAGLLLAKEDAPSEGADSIDIVAQRFTSVGNTTTISGNVKIKKGNDTLDADTVVIHTDDKRNPISYEAKGSVRFTIITTDKRELKGRSKRLIYTVAKDEYRLYDDAFVEEIGQPNTLKGDEIVLGRDGSYATVVGKSKNPARITFTINKN